MTEYELHCDPIVEARIRKNFRAKAKRLRKYQKTRDFIITILKKIYKV
jgi:hypothetical protein